MKTWAHKGEGQARMLPFKVGGRKGWGGGGGLHKVTGAKDSTHTHTHIYAHPNAR